MSRDVLALIGVVSLWALPGVVLLAALVRELRVERRMRAASPQDPVFASDGVGANTPCPGATVRIAETRFALAPGFAPVTPAARHLHAVPATGTVVPVDFRARRRTNGDAA